jgi:hypothetical protein
MYEAKGKGKNCQCTRVIADPARPHASIQPGVSHARSAGNGVSSAISQAPVSSEAINRSWPKDRTHR